MREINRVFWHCSATREGWDIGAKAIDTWHKGKGWRGIGYHYVIRLDGTVEEGRPVWQIGAHVKGHNRDSIGICYVGGCEADGKTPKDTRTSAQKAALYKLTGELLGQFPGATVHGHNEIDPKACPSFDVKADWEEYQRGSGFVCPGCCVCEGKK